jgi:hypothetical protein
MLKKILGAASLAQTRSKWTNPIHFVQGDRLSEAEKGNWTRIFSDVFPGFPFAELNAVKAALETAGFTIKFTLFGSNIEVIKHGFIMEPHDVDVCCWGPFTAEKVLGNPWEYKCEALDKALQGIPNLMRVPGTEHFFLYKIPWSKGVKTGRLEVKCIKEDAPGRVSSFQDALWHINLNTFLETENISDLFHTICGAYTKADHTWFSVNKLLGLFSPIRLNVDSHYSVNEDKFLRYMLLLTGRERQPKRELLISFYEPLIVLGFFNDLYHCGSSFSYRLSHQIQSHFPKQPEKAFTFLIGILKKVLQYQMMLTASFNEKFFNWIEENFNVLNLCVENSQVKKNTVRYENGILYINEKVADIEKACSTEEHIKDAIRYINQYIKDKDSVDSIIIVSLLHSLFLAGSLKTSYADPAFLQFVSNTAPDPNQNFSRELLTSVMYKVHTAFEKLPSDSEVKKSVMAVLDNINRLLTPEPAVVPQIREVPKSKSPAKKQPDPKAETSRSRSDSVASSASITSISTNSSGSSLSSVVSLSSGESLPSPPKSSKKAKGVTLSFKERTEALAGAPAEQWNSLIQSLDSSLSSQSLKLLQTAVIMHCTSQVFTHLSDESQLYIQDLCQKLAFPEVSSRGPEATALFIALLGAISPQNPTKRLAFIMMSHNAAYFDGLSAVVLRLLEGLRETPITLTQPDFEAGLNEISVVFKDSPVEWLEVYGFIFSKINTNEPLVKSWREHYTGDSLVIVNTLFDKPNLDDFVGKWITYLNLLFTQKSSRKLSLEIIQTLIASIINQQMSDTRASKIVLAYPGPKAIVKKNQVFLVVEGRLLDILTRTEPTKKNGPSASGMKVENLVEWIEHLSVLFDRFIKLLLPLYTKQELFDGITNIVTVLSKIIGLLPDSKVLTAKQAQDVERALNPIRAFRGIQDDRSVGSYIKPLRAYIETCLPPPSSPPPVALLSSQAPSLDDTPSVKGKEILEMWPQNPRLCQRLGTPPTHFAQLYSNPSSLSAKDYKRTLKATLECLKTRPFIGLDLCIHVFKQDVTKVTETIQGEFAVYISEACIFLKEDFTGFLYRIRPALAHLVVDEVSRECGVRLSNSLLSTYTKALEVVSTDASSDNWRSIEFLRSCSKTLCIINNILLALTAEEHNQRFVAVDYLDINSLVEYTSCMLCMLVKVTTERDSVLETLEGIPNLPKVDSLYHELLTLLLENTIFLKKLINNYPSLALTYLHDIEGLIELMPSFAHDSDLEKQRLYLLSLKSTNMAPLALDEGFLGEDTLLDEIGDIVALSEEVYIQTFEKIIRDLSSQPVLCLDVCTNILIKDMTKLALPRVQELFVNYLNACTLLEGQEDTIFVEKIVPGLQRLFSHPEHLHSSVNICELWILLMLTMLKSSEEFSFNTSQALNSYIKKSSMIGAILGLLTESKSQSYAYFMKIDSIVQIIEAVYFLFVDFMTSKFPLCPHTLHSVFFEAIESMLDNLILLKQLLNDHPGLGYTHLNAVENHCFPFVAEVLEQKCVPKHLRERCNTLLVPLLFLHKSNFATCDQSSDDRWVLHLEPGRPLYDRFGERVVFFANSRGDGQKSKA